MLVDLGQNKIIEWVLKRVSRAKMVDEVILATSNLAQDDVLVEIAEENNINVFRGSESDVLKRYYDAALKINADIIIRICADNPFIDPYEIDRLVKFFLNTDCDYAFNHQNKLNSNYADGFGAEIFSWFVLNKINSLAKQSAHREHITLYLWEKKHSFIMKPVPAPKNLSYPNFKFDIDIPEDKNKMDLIVNNGATINSTAEEIINIFQQNVN